MERSHLAILLLFAQVACGAGDRMPVPSNVQLAVEKEPPPPPPDIRDDPACKLFRWPLTPMQAALILKRTDTFADTGIYFAGDPPPQMAAFNVLLDQADAAAWFDEVKETGGTVGRLYALCAFQLLDESRATKLAQELRREKGTVYTQFGCTGGDQQVPVLIDAIQKESCGKWFRGANERTYTYYSELDNICMQAPAGR